MGNTIVGIMGAVIAVLVCGIAGGAYYMYQSNNKALVATEEDYGMEMGDLEDGVAGIDTADSAALMSNPVSPRRTNNISTFSLCSVLFSIDDVYVMYDVVSFDLVWVSFLV